MGLWNDQVVPRVTNLLLDVEAVRRGRAAVCAGLAGDVVELGFGSGLNMPHYPTAVTAVWAVDPSAVGRRLAARRVHDSPVPVHFAGADAQTLPFPDRRFDAALSTFTLCTIPDVRRALEELLRVLAPGGAFHFLEHGRAPEPGVARWQHRLTPLNSALAGGCRLTRDVGALVRDAGFELVEYSTYYGEGPKPFAYRYQGVARRPVES